MGAIGFTGDQQYAVTTKPFEGRRTTNNWNPANTAAGQK
jgi:cytochrome c oxidase subunit 2